MVQLSYSEREREVSTSRLDGLLEQLQDRKARTSVATVALDTMVVHPEDGGLRIRKRNGDKAGALLNYHSFGQLYRSVCPDGSRTARQTPPELIAPVINYHLTHGAKADGKDAKLILGRMPGSDTYVTRAVVGPTYGLIHDADVLQALLQAIDQVGNGWVCPEASHFGPRGQRRFLQAHICDSGMTVHLIDASHPIEFRRPDGQVDVLYRAIQVRNSEVGTRGLMVRFVLVRYDCANLEIVNVLGEHKVYLRHTSGAPDRFMLKTVPAIERFAALPPHQVNEYLTRMYEMKLADTAEGARALLTRKGFSGKLADLIVARAEADRHTVGGSPYSAWGLLNAASANARDKDYIDDTIDAADVAGKVFSSFM